MPPRVPLWIIRTLAVLTLVLGAILFWLPIPLGAPLLAVGAALLVTGSVTARRWLRRLRRRRQSLDNFLEGLEPRLPGDLAESLRQTRGSAEDTVDMEAVSREYIEAELKRQARAGASSGAEGEAPPSPPEERAAEQERRAH